jgi:hypothetical protein
LQAAFLATASSSIVSYVLYLRQMPHGAWDAFAIWNLKARFMFRLPSGWKNILPSKLGYAHLDYPFLLPDAVTRAWTWLGQDPVWVPALIGALFSICTISVLYFSLREAANRTAALIGGIFLVGTPLFVVQGACQVADIPVAFYFLVTSVSLWMYYKSDKPDFRLLLLIGCTAGLAGWTKNEGNPFLLAVMAVIFFFPLDGSPVRERLRRLAAVALGSVPGVIAIIVFKTSLAGPNWMAPSLGKAAVIARLSDLSRWALVFKKVAEGLVGFGGWPVNPVLLALAGVSIKKLRASERRAMVPLISILVFTVLVDVSVYMVAPNTPWLIDTSLDRLLLQLFPTWIFVTLALWASANAGEDNGGERSQHLLVDEQPVPVQVAHKKRSRRQRPGLARNRNRSVKSGEREIWRSAMNTFPAQFTNPHLPQLERRLE